MWGWKLSSGCGCRIANFTSSVRVAIHGTSEKQIHGRLRLQYPSVPLNEAHPCIVYCLGGGNQRISFRPIISAYLFLGTQTAAKTSALTPSKKVYHVTS